MKKTLLNKILEYIDSRVELFDLKREGKFEHPGVPRCYIYDFKTDMVVVHVVKDKYWSKLGGKITAQVDYRNNEFSEYLAKYVGHDVLCNKNWFFRASPEGSDEFNADNFTNSVDVICGKLGVQLGLMKDVISNSEINGLLCGEFSYLAMIGQKELARLKLKSWL